MITTRYALCAIRAIRDAMENRITLVDVLEEVGSPAFPVVLPRASFIWALIREEGDEQTHTGSIVLSQGSQQLGEFPFNIDFQQALFTRSIAVIGGLVIPQPGRIDVRYEIPNVVSATYTVHAIGVAQVVAQGTEPGGPPPPAAPLAGMLS